jgi:hypothetical protein
MNMSEVIELIAVVDGYHLKCVSRIRIDRRSGNGGKPSMEISFLTEDEKEIPNLATPSDELHKVILVAGTHVLLTVGRWIAPNAMLAKVGTWIEPE